MKEATELARSQMIIRLPRGRYGIRAFQKEHLAKQKYGGTEMTAFSEDMKESEYPSGNLQGDT